MTGTEDDIARFLAFLLLSGEWHERLQNSGTAKNNQSSASIMVLSQARAKAHASQTEVVDAQASVGG